MTNNRIQLNEPDSVRLPARRPWLLLAVVLLVAIFFWIRHRSAQNQNPGKAAGPAADVADKSSLPLSTNPVGDGLPPAASRTSPQADALIAEARKLEEGGNRNSARAKYLGVLDQRLSTEARSEVERRLGDLGVAMVLSPEEMPEKVDHVVRPGDSLDRIARTYGCSRRLIQKGNQISNPSRIKPGDVLRVFTGRFLVMVSKSQNYLMVYMNDRFFRRYAVATGKFGKTPIGAFQISDQIAEPVWWRPDGKEIPFGNPENILGTRWMALKAIGDTPAVRGYGIHGTWDDSSVGQSVSMGCVRMCNADVEELFDILPLGTIVVITE
jgi:lipoprotein-anchoring transpeptidase ErfK/SrfK